MSSNIAIALTVSFGLSDGAKGRPIIVVEHRCPWRKTSWPREPRQFYLNFNNIIDCKTCILLLIQLLNYLETKPPFIPAHISGVDDTKGAKLSWFFLLPYSPFSYFFYYTFLTRTINMSNEVYISTIYTLEHTVHSFKLANFYFPSSFQPILGWKKVGSDIFKASPFSKRKLFSVSTQLWL